MVMTRPDEGLAPTDLHGASSGRVIARVPGIPGARAVVGGLLVALAGVGTFVSWQRASGPPDRSFAVADRDLAPGERVTDEAVRFVVQSGQASTSMLQRRFRIGFSRAGRLIDVMEQDGIIGPAEGSKSREILVAADYYEQVDNWPK